MEILDFDRSIIIIDKPSGMTSFQAVDFIKKQLGLNKASHFGTLDPMVTGVLPMALGKAARLSGYFSKQDKEYTGIMHAHEPVEREEIEKAIKQKFLGKIRQIPPLKSNVKRQEREREIKKFDILEKEENDFLFSVECEAGTYIRKLVHDLGREIGIGMHMTELRRTRASIFEEKDAITLYQFAEAVQEYKKGKPEKLQAMLIPAEITAKIMPKIEIKAEAIEKIMHGSPIFSGMIKNNEPFRKNDFIAVMHESRLIEVAIAEIESKSIRDLNHENQRIIAKPRTVLS